MTACNPRLRYGRILRSTNAQLAKNAPRTSLGLTAFVRLPVRMIVGLAGILVLTVSVSMPSAAARATLVPALPPGWPTSFELGMADGLGDAAGIRATAPFKFRSQYLAGGVNTGNGWTTWAPAGAYVTQYAQESFDQGITPVFDYYMLLHSSPSAGADEGERDYANLNNVSTMTAYYADLKLFFERAATFGRRPVILHLEPDLWGFMQQRALFDNAAGVPAKVTATRVEGLSRFPDSVAGFAQAIIGLRDRYAPNVLVAYHLSVWGTGQDIIYTNPDDARVDLLAKSASAFYRSLQTNFDIVFADASDRDAAFKQYQYGDNAAWWTEDDYARNVRFLAGFASNVGKRIVLWQMPLGNTKMRAQNNTWGHYQDNHVEWLLDDPERKHLVDYVNAGVVAAIFGGGGAGTTCACDAANDGLTNPPAVNGNSLVSLSADDDGGFFRARAATYYSAGALVLPAGSTTPVASAPATTDCVVSADGTARLCPRSRRRSGGRKRRAGPRPLRRGATSTSTSCPGTARTSSRRSWRPTLVRRGHAECARRAEAVSRYRGQPDRDLTAARGCHRQSRTPPRRRSDTLEKEETTSPFIAYSRSAFSRARALATASPPIA